MKYGIIGWGRGCGWMLKGLAESLPWIPKTEEAYGRLRSLYQTLTMQLLQDQRPDGGYSWQAEALEGHRDTSAEGMIGTAIQLGLQQGLLEDRDGTICRMTEKLQKAVVTSLTENNVKDCSGECKGFAEYPQVYGSYPWGTGSVLTFLARMKNEK